MPHITVCCEPTLWQTVLAKMAFLAARLDPTHPCYNLPAGQLDLTLWQNVEDCLTAHGLVPIR